MTITVILLTLFVVVWVTALVIGVTWLVISEKEKRTAKMLVDIEADLIPRLRKELEHGFDGFMDSMINKSIEMITKMTTKEE